MVCLVAMRWVPQQGPTPAKNVLATVEARAANPAHTWPTKVPRVVAMRQAFRLQVTPKDRLLLFRSFLLYIRFRGGLLFQRCGPSGPMIYCPRFPAPPLIASHMLAVMLRCIFPWHNDFWGFPQLWMAV